jgi:hypothetical protein
LEGEEIQRCMREIGFGDNITEKALDDLCRKGFMHTISYSRPDFDASYIVSRLGGYIIRHFIADMMFIENTMMDTFIADRDVWENLKDLTTQVYSERDTIRRMRARKRRVVAFFDYMRRLYAPLRDESIRRGLPKEWCGHPFEAIATQFETNLQRAIRSAERNYGQDETSAYQPSV